MNWAEFWDADNDAINFDGADDLTQELQLSSTGGPLQIYLFICQFETIEKNFGVQDPERSPFHNLLLQKWISKKSFSLFCRLLPFLLSQGTKSVLGCVRACLIFKEKYWMSACWNYRSSSFLTYFGLSGSIKQN